MRLEESLVGRIDRYAESRLSNRTAVVQAACLAFLEAAGGGVPELEEAVESRRAPGPVSKGPQRPTAAPPSPRAPGDPRLSEPTLDQFRSAADLARARARWESRGEW
jgi:hypothetical protein